MLYWLGCGKYKRTRPWPDRPQAPRTKRIGMVLIGRYPEGISLNPHMYTILLNINPPRYYNVTYTSPTNHKGSDLVPIRAPFQIPTKRNQDQRESGNYLRRRPYLTNLFKARLKFQRDPDCSMEAVPLVLYRKNCPWHSITMVINAI